MAFFLLVGLLAASTPLHAQTGTVTGTVIDATSDAALSGANVGLEGTSLGATTEDGRFTIPDVPTGTYTVRASIVGYQTARREVNVASGETVRIKLRLSQQTIALDEITVEANRQFVAQGSATGAKTITPVEEIPQATSVITRNRLDIQGLDALSDAFRYTPGVKGEAFGNDTRVDFLRFRGFSDNGNAVFRDGLQLRSSGFGQFRPELYGVQRVTVLRGPSSALFGLGNPGGLVNLVTKRPPVTLSGEVEAALGNFNHQEGRLDVGGPIAGSQRARFRLTALGRSSDTQVEFVDNDRLYVAPALTVKPTSATTITVLSHYQRDNTGSTNQFLPAAGTVRDNPNGDIDRDTFTGNPDFDDYDRTVYSVGYVADHRLTDWIKVSQNLRYNTLDIDSKQVFGGGLQEDQRTLNRFAFTADAETEAFTVDTNVQADVSTGPVAHTLLAGLDFQSYDFEEIQGFGAAPPIDIFDPTFSETTPSAPTSLDNETRQDQVGVYLQNQVRLRDAWVLTLNGRHDWVDSETEDRTSGTTTDQDDSEFTGRAGLVYLSPIGLSPYVSYSTSFQPTVGTNAEGQAFDPTTGEQYELGIRYTVPSLSARVTATGFRIVRENVQTTDPENPQNQVQTGEVRSQGIELGASAAPSTGLNVNLTYTFQDVEITEDNDGNEGNRLSQAPEHEVSAWTDYTVRAGVLDGLGLGGGIRYKDETFASNANTLEVDGATLVDAALFYDWRSFGLEARAENLFDNTYVATCSSAAACFFGSERSGTIALTYQW
ncbi:TonB-dependent siderophore receptor [Salinibacter altiplanensis]|uniref:TonB-dependent siderophore receptor n=1 Tax=Salinibacter altiplanensis TaxID=1803181 RepID=UPI001F330056|nr:TonB-dependent siderophore receptor [Salinibacter altiplanensis]